jgi:hypothetical protein
MVFGDGWGVSGSAAQQGARKAPAAYKYGNNFFIVYILIGMAARQD